MPIAIANPAVGVRLENSDVTAALALWSIKQEDHRMRLEEMRLDDALKARQHQREQEARATENERLRLQSAENERIRALEEGRRNQEHEREMRRLEVENNNNAREYELRLNGERQKTLKLKLASDRKEEHLEKLKLQRLRLEHACG